MSNYAFVEGKKIKSAKFNWDLRFSLKNGTKPEKIKKTLKSVTILSLFMKTLIDFALKEEYKSLKSVGDKLNEINSLNN